MKPAGIILTYMSRRDWKGKSFWIKLRTIFFNLFLFIGQLIGLVVGTAIGKIKWGKKVHPAFKVLLIIAIVCYLSLIPYSSFITHNYWLPPIWIIAALFFIVILRGIDWRKVWRAAQASHVRLCLRQTGLKSSEEWAKIHEKNVHILDADGWDRANFKQSWNEKITEAEFKKRCSASTTEWNEILYKSDSQKVPTYEYINFGWKFAQLESWRMDMCNGKRFEYQDPRFDPSPQFIAAMTQYAEVQVGKRYDELQLLSGAVNLVIWMLWWPLWGREVVKWFNRPGGLEFCSSGVTACLRDAEGREICRDCHSFFGKCGVRNQEEFTKFFKGYSTAMVSPCLFAIDENWRKIEN